MLQSRWMLAGAFALFGVLLVEAKVELAPVFSDNAVLQRDMAVPVWGKADPGETVTVKFAGQSVQATADADGKWMVKLEPLAASSENRTMEVSGKDNTVQVNNVLVGEVWLCSGQSNMELPLWSGNARFRHRTGDKVADESNYPLIRFSRMVPYGWSPLPRTDFKMTWAPVQPDNIRPFTAAGFFFGRELFKNLNVPIGLISSHWGGTRIEPWIPPVGFDSVPELASMARSVNAKLPGTKEFKELNEKAAATYAAWAQETRAAVAENRTPPPLPAYPGELVPYAARTQNPHQQTTVLYNRMIYPFVPYAMRGAIWYQGCSNVGDNLYTQKMHALYNGWQKVFENPDFQFFFVQLAPFTYGGNPEKLPEMWEMQEKFADAEKNAGMAVINDVGDLKDIHPSDKETVGKRLAALALNRTYGKKEMKADSPKLREYKIDGGKFLLDFDFVETWGTVGGKPAANFEVAGLDGVYYPAGVKIEGKQLVVSSDKVAAPKQLRYMWKQTAEGTLCNEAGLPLGAFRIVNQVTEAELFAALQKENTLVYEYDLKSGSGAFGRRKVAYKVDNSAKLEGDIARITYFVRLEAADGKVSWVSAAMDPFTNDPGKIGVPTPDSGATFQTRVSNLVVNSNVPGVRTGAIANGNIEFWPNNYGQRNAARIPGASDATFDFGDELNSVNPGHGSMQVHNFGDKQTVFAYNNFGAGASADLGIGNAPQGNPDWTFSRGAQNWAKATLYVFVKEKPRMTEAEAMAPVTALVPAAADMKMLYTLDLKRNIPFGSAAQYEVDNSTRLSGKPARVGYLLALTDKADKTSWVFVTLDAFTTELGKLGVPTAPSKAIFQQNVSNLEVASNVEGVKTGKFPEGNIEFWPNNYATPNAQKVPGASDGNFDFGDQRDNGGDYGSMQIHNFKEKQTIFAYNHFPVGPSADVGIGNAPQGNPDWTFSGSMTRYKTARLYVLVTLE